MHATALGARLRGWLRVPLARALALSIAVHAAVAMVVQPQSGTRQRVIVLNTRILPQAAVPVPPSAAAAAAPVAAPPVSTPAETAKERAQAAPSEALPPPAPATAAVGPVQPEQPVPGQPAADGSQTEGTDALPEVPVMQDLSWYSARQVDVRPAPPVLPKYPAAARRRGLQGSVVIELSIDQFGAVHEAVIVAAEPPGVFDDTVLQAFRQARFKPALRDGQPVRYIGRYLFLFEQDD